ncbi:histidine phosphatase family protein [Burkholderia cenocepacia]|uniref:histidine phosphatase family protein n=1 Tax=Burkholderia cenocepacia TaxID=95486 RepID=UPI0038CBF7F0
MTLVLVRHGETAWNAERRMQGRPDNPLTAAGREQARATAIALEGFVPHEVVASPLVRARQTAGVIALHLGVADVRLDDDLIERDLGEAEGLHVDVAAQRWPHGEYAGGESVASVAERGARAIARLRGVDAIVVAHGLLLRATLERATGAPVARLLTAEHVLLHDDGTIERPALAARTDGSLG